MDRDQTIRFRDAVWAFYRDKRRSLPWRDHVSDYGVLVSEVMLQQTQVNRVLERYKAWLEEIPDFTALAQINTHDLMAKWQGMGYNRRALWLREAARRIVEQFGGSLPRDPKQLELFAGIGPNTAGSIAAFAFNLPVPFIETNIRRVYIHWFFAGKTNVDDRAILPLVVETLDMERPREWYWALMDMGADMAKRIPNPNRMSRHYATSPKFAGSVRQLRGQVLRRLLEGNWPLDAMGLDDPRLASVVCDLVKEGFLQESNGRYGLAK